MKYYPTNILVDLDGVIANFGKTFSELCNLKYGDRCQVIENTIDMPFWHWEDWYDITENEILDVWEDIRATSNFWMSLEILDYWDWVYFRNALNKHESINVYFITAREETDGLSVANQSALWLTRQGWDNPFVIQNRKKGELSKLLDIKFVIDDKDKNIIDINKHIPDCKLFAYPAEHNKKMLNESGIEYSRGKLREFTDSVLEYLKTA